MAIEDKDATDLSVAPVVGPEDPRRFTDSGIEVEPRLRRGRPAARPPGAAGRAGRLPLHARRAPGDVPRAAVDDAPVRRLRLGQGVQRPLQVPARARVDRALDGLRPADPARPGLRRPALPRRGRPHRGGDRHDRGHADGLRRHPARRGLDLDDDQRARHRAAGALRARRRGAGRRLRPAARHRPERHPQGVHRARELHLPAHAVDATDHRPVRLLPRAAAALQHGLDLGLPHAREGLLGGPGGRLHARQRRRLRAGGARRRAEGRRLRARGWPSSSTATTTSSRRSRSSARRATCGRG